MAKPSSYWERASEKVLQRPKHPCMATETLLMAVVRGLYRSSLVLTFGVLQ